MANKYEFCSITSTLWIKSDLVAGFQTKISKVFEQNDLFSTLSQTNHLNLKQKLCIYVLMTCHQLKDQICYNNQLQMQVQQLSSKSSALKGNRMKSSSQREQPDSQNTINEKNYSNKKEIRKEKNRLAAQKSRDRKQSHFQFLQRENKSLKDIISCCETCSTRVEQWKGSSQLSFKTTGQLQSNKNEEQRVIQGEQPLVGIPRESYESVYMRRQEDSSQNVSKFLWLCLIAAFICFAQLRGENPTGQPTIRLGLQVNTTQTLVQKQNEKQASSVNRQTQKSLMFKQSKQCLKCMECLKNMTNATANSLIPLINNETNPNSTKNGTNSTSKILFCKSKAAFFKKIYGAIASNQKSSFFKTRSIGKVQAYGKALSQFLDKECFVDSQLEANQLYTIEFTVAIMELVAVNDTKSHDFRNISVE